MRAINQCKQQQKAKYKGTKSTPPKLMGPFKSVVLCHTQRVCMQEEVEEREKIVVLVMIQICTSTYVCTDIHRGLHRAITFYDVLHLLRFIIQSLKSVAVTIQSLQNLLAVAAYRLKKGKFS